MKLKQIIGLDMAVPEYYENKENKSCTNETLGQYEGFRNYSD